MFGSGGVRKGAAEGERLLHLLLPDPLLLLQSLICTDDGKILYHSRMCLRGKLSGQPKLIKLQAAGAASSNNNDPNITYAEMCVQQILDYVIKTFCPLGRYEWKISFYQSKLE